MVYLFPSNINDKLNETDFLREDINASIVHLRSMIRSDSRDELSRIRNISSHSNTRLSLECSHPPQKLLKSLGMIIEGFHMIVKSISMVIDDLGMIVEGFGMLIQYREHFRFLMPG